MLDELSRVNNLHVRAIDCVAHERHFLFRLDRGVVNQLFELGNLVLDHRHRFRKMARGDRKMSGYDIELFGNLTTLSGDMLPLVT